MKTSVSLSAFPAREGMPVLFSGGTRENAAMIAGLGYDGVDLFIKDPVSEESQKTIELLKEYELGIGVIMPAALAGEGFTLGDTRREIRRECIRRVGEIIELAGEIGGMVSLGLVRGRRCMGESMEDFYARFTESCEELLKISEPAKVSLLIEPINRYEINTINSSEEGLAYIQKSGLPLYLMLDTFHMNIEDVSMEAAFQKALPLTKHIHFLDSNRLAPSMGHLDMAGYYELIEETGYAGYLCLEALPKPDFHTCASRGAAFFDSMKKRKTGGEKRL